MHLEKPSNQNTITINLKFWHPLKIKTGYKSALLIHEQQICRELEKKDVDKYKVGENGQTYELVEISLVHCNLVKTGYQQTSKVFLLLFQINNSAN